MSYNDFMVFLLRTPLHGLFSKGTMLVTVTGRKTGKNITLPVSYDETGGGLWVLSRRDRMWWRNLQNGAEAVLRLRGRDVRATAELVLDEEAVRVRLGDYLSRYPRLAKYLNVGNKDGAFVAEDLAREAKNRVFVRFDVLGSAPKA